MSTEFREALDAADREMGELVRQRGAIDERIKQLMATRDALAALLENKCENETSPRTEPGLQNSAELDVGDLGITEAIKKLLSASRAPLSPTDIAFQLDKAGFPLRKYANALAVIHTTVRRLEKQGEVLPFRDPAGKIFGYAMQWRIG